jgi:hypothetical protein
MNKETSSSQQVVLSSIQSSLDQMIIDQSCSNQSDSNLLNSNQSNSKQLSQNQVDQQIKLSIDEACLNEKNQKISTILINETNTVDLSTSSQKLENLITRKKKTEEKRQIALKKKFESIKVRTLMLSVDETLKNAQKTLFEDLKIAKTEHVIIQQLINQIERARTNLDLTDETSIIIDQVQTEKSFEFASINLTKKSNKYVLYCGTISENFRQLKKAMNQKMTKLISEQLKNQQVRARLNETIETSKNCSIKPSKAQLNSNSKKILEAAKIQTTKRSQMSERFKSSVEANTTSLPSSI